MNTFEMSATVEDQGRMHLEGIPFLPGTRVEVSIAPVRSEAESAADRAVRLLAALSKARNTETIGPLRRSEIYDRDVLG